jgi:son of sevenless-like protein
MSAVIAGLKNILPSRLPLTWTHISRASQFDTLTKINDPAGNFSVLRSLLDHVDRPCIPFVNIYLTDIVHCQDQFPDSTIGAAGHPFIHFQKRTKWADAVTSIVRHQAKLYQLPEVGGYRTSR